MLAYIHGSLAYVGENFIVVDNSGMGYRIYTSGMCLDHLPSIGESIKIFTYMHVREDEVSLYGFPTNEELEVFKVLIGISGVGPKVALSILTTLTINELHLAVASDDVKAISRANGVGAKGAQRIILELKDKLHMEDMLDAAYQDAVGGPVKTTNATKDVMEALTSLGYGNTESYRAIQKVQDADKLTADQLLKAALKYMI